MRKYKEKKEKGNLGRNFLGSELFTNGGTVEFDVAVVISDDSVRDLLGLLVDLGHLPANEPLDGEESVLRVNDGLTLGDLANESIAALGVGDNGGGGSLTLGVGDDGGLAPFHGGDGGVSCSQVDADDFLIDDAERTYPPGSALDLDEGLGI